jgi:hypothetical protein
MFITLIEIMNYNEKMKLDTWSKQTQSNPIYSELIEPILPATPFGGQVLTAVSLAVKVLPISGFLDTD